MFVCWRWQLKVRSPHLEVDERDDLGVRYGWQVHPVKQRVGTPRVQAGPQQQERGQAGNGSQNSRDGEDNLQVGWRPALDKS